uniref:Transmembrane protein n=1 Tax=Heterorhabditis bacteriophora TaxID=37862 RepID=A0A1I7WU45_HETBA
MSGSTPNCVKQAMHVNTVIPERSSNFIQKYIRVQNATICWKNFSMVIVLALSFVHLLTMIPNFMFREHRTLPVAKQVRRNNAVQILVTRYALGPLSRMGHQLHLILLVFLNSSILIIIFSFSTYSSILNLFKMNSIVVGPLSASYLA